MWPETGGAALLDVAQRALVEEVLPELTGPARFAALLVGSALRMAAREIAQADALAQTSDEIAMVAREHGWQDPRALVDAVRSGALDADANLHGALWAHAAVRTSISKPSGLSRVERGVAGLADDDGQTA